MSVEIILVILGFGSLGFSYWCLWGYIGKLEKSIGDLSKMKKCSCECKEEPREF